MKFLLSLLLIGCSAGNSDPSDASSETTGSNAVSVCFLPQKDIGVACYLNQPTSQSWVWVSNSLSGEQSATCNVKLCPVGYMCIVQSDVSGKSAGEMLFGTCQ